MSRGKPVPKPSSSSRARTNAFTRTRYCINRFHFEGFVGADPEWVTTHSKRPMCKFSLCQTPHRVGAQRAGHPAWGRLNAFDSIAEAILENVREGERIIVAGNFHSSKGTYGFLMRMAATAFWKVASAGPTFVNWWEFEGKVCSPPKMSVTAIGDDMVKFGLVQPGLVYGSNGSTKRTLPTLMNARSLGITARHISEYQKGDIVFLTGHLAAIRRNGVVWPIVDRALPVSKEFYADRMLSSPPAARILPPDLEQGLVVI